MNEVTRNQLKQHFDTAFAAPDGIAKLRELIMTLAMQNKLVEKDPNDPPAIETVPWNGMIKKWAEAESYALMLPVPENAVIQKQVICNAATKIVFNSDGEGSFRQESRTKPAPGLVRSLPPQVRIDQVEMRGCSRWQRGGLMSSSYSIFTNAKPKIAIEVGCQ